jgi:hypothetical protein
MKIGHRGSVTSRPPAADERALTPARGSEASGFLLGPDASTSPSREEQAVSLGVIGGIGRDYLGRTRLEHKRAVSHSRIVEARGRPGLREFKADELGPGPFRTVTDSDGNRYCVFSGVAFDRGMLVPHLPETVCAFVLRGDLDPAVVVMLERVG